MNAPRFLRATLGDIGAALTSAHGGSPDVRIAIADGLPDLGHPALHDAPIEIFEAMVPSDGGTPDPHGTQICSLIFGRGGGVSGIAPGCAGLVLPIFFGQARDNRARPASQLDLARPIDFALERNVSILNVSAGQKTATPEAEAHLTQALERCAERRVLVVAAAGNDHEFGIHRRRTDRHFALGLQLRLPG